MGSYGLTPPFVDPWPIPQATLCGVGVRRLRAQEDESGQGVEGVPAWHQNGLPRDHPESFEGLP